MKNLVLTLLLSFSLFTNNPIYAGTNTLTISYPASSGTYNKFMINTQAGSVPANACNNPSNAGLLFMSPAGTLQLCACTSNNGGACQGVQVPTGETCFNRFSNSSAGPGCPAPYTLTTINGASSDSFITSAGPGGPGPGGNYTVYSFVCCTNNSIVNPQ